MVVTFTQYCALSVTRCPGVDAISETILVRREDVHSAVVVK
jgi:hypothetical protein